MKVTIKKGKHLSNQLTIPRFNIFNRNSGVLQAEVIFNDSCKYVFEDTKEQADWNKLMGCSWGFFPPIKSFQMHENSSRFVWRYNPITDLFELTWYIYKNGVKVYGTNGYDILSFKSGDSLELTIIPHSFLGNTEVSFEANINGVLKLRRNLFQPIPNIDGWVAPGYFGGTLPAPHDMNYEINYL